MAHLRLKSAKFARQAGGVGLHGLLAQRGASGLDDQHRFAGGARAAQQIGEARAVLDPFDIERDDARMRIVDCVLEKVAHLQVSLVAQRHAKRKPHAQVIRARQHGAGQRAALADQRDLALDEPVVAHQGLRIEQAHVGMAVEVAHAVGTDDAHAGAARDGQQPVLQGRALGAAFGELRGDHQDDLHAGGGAVLERGFRALLRHGDQGHVHRLADGLHAGPGLHALHQVGAGVDGIHRTTKAELAQQRQHAAAPLRQLVGCAQHRDGTRIERGAHRLQGRGDFNGCHGVSSPASGRARGWSCRTARRRAPTASRMRPARQTPATWHRAACARSHPGS